MGASLAAPAAPLAGGLGQCHGGEPERRADRVADQLVAADRLARPLAAGGGEGALDQPARDQGAVADPERGDDVPGDLAEAGPDRENGLAFLEGAVADGASAQDRQADRAMTVQYASFDGPQQVSAAASACTSPVCSGPGSWR
jgi:hypothetical protein